MLKLLVSIGIVGLLGTAYIFAYRVNNKGRKPTGCGTGGCASCKGCAMHKE